MDGHAGCEADAKNGRVAGFQTNQNGIIKTRVSETRPYGTKARSQSLIIQALHDPGHRLTFAT